MRGTGAEEPVGAERPVNAGGAKGSVMSSRGLANWRQEEPVSGTKPCAKKPTADAPAECGK
jgi:hypothetical protein